MMETLLPYLDILGPDGQQFHVELTKDHITVGRFDLFNDVALEPDPQQLITRKVHCALARDVDGWWVTDNGSVNRTFLRRDTILTVVDGRMLLSPGESICILGKLTEDGKPFYWELTFYDPLGTRPAQLHNASPMTSIIEYDWIQAKLFRIDGNGRRAIEKLRPQEHKLIRYMDQRNRANGSIPVMCSFEELITAVWGENSSHTEGDMNHLMWELRQKLEVQPKNPQFLETVRGLGYRLITRPLSKEELPQTSE